VAVGLRYLTLRQLVGLGLASWPVFEVDKSTSPQNKGSVNRQQKYATTSNVVPDHLMAISSPPTQNRHWATTTQLPRTFDSISSLLRRSTKLNRSAENARTTVRRWPAVVASELP